MKKVFATALCLLLIFTLAACGLPRPEPEPEKTPEVVVVVDGISYRSGFYTGLWPAASVFTSEAIVLNGEEYKHIYNKQFDIVRMRDGTDRGLLLCAESQWEDAQAYYANPANFTYYCHKARERIGIRENLVAIPNIDTEKFDALFYFASKNNYNLIKPNKNVPTQLLPMPDEEKQPSLVFYAESEDKAFTSFKGYTFHIIDGQLWLVYQYLNAGEGQLKAVKAPADLSDYFVQLVSEMA